MKHFSPSEFVDFAEGTLAPARAAHADRCDECRAQGALVRETIRASAMAAVPEPSPLFWEHFSARVREGIAAEPRDSAWAWWRSGAPAGLAAAIALVAVVAAGVSLLRDSRTAEATLPIAREQSTPASVIARNGDLDAGVDAANAAVWAVLTAAASDMAIDEARDAGMKPHPAAVDRAVQDMTTAELNELGRLLQSELKRSGN